MNTKLILVLIAFLAILILISFFITRQNLETTALMPQKIETVNEQITTEVQPPAVQMSSSQRAITYIKKYKSSPLITSVESERGKSIGSKSVGKRASSEPESGVTIINKHPTPEKTKEMNSRGIVPY
jgi:hypothetical protein